MFSLNTLLQIFYQPHLHIEYKSEFDLDMIRCINNLFPHRQKEIVTRTKPKQPHPFRYSYASYIHFDISDI